MLDFVEMRIIGFGSVAMMPNQYKSLQLLEGYSGIWNPLLSIIIQKALFGEEQVIVVVESSRRGS
jgi:hypothetical protein